MNLSDRIASIFGLENEPNAVVSIDLETGELNINCSLESLCCFLVKKERLQGLIEGGIELQIPHINVKHGDKLIYRFPPSSVREYGINWERCNPGVKEADYARDVHRTKLFIMSQMGIDVDGLNFPPEYKEKWQCSDES